jgi:predicted dinucleotide-binding enzyme
MSMNIGVIGAGSIGKTVARLARSVGHDVAIANSRGPETLTSLVEEIGITAVTAAIAVADSTRIAQYRRESDAFGSALSTLLGGNAAVGAA